MRENLTDGRHESAALAHLGERQTEVHFESPYHSHTISGGTVFDPQKRQLSMFLLPCFCSLQLYTFWKRIAVRGTDKCFGVGCRTARIHKVCEGFFLLILFKGGERHLHAAQLKNESRRTMPR